MTPKNPKRLFLIVCAFVLCCSQLGCVLSHSHESPAPSPINALPPTERGVVTWDDSALPPFADPTFVFRLPKDWCYFALNAPDAQCLAVENSSVGELLEKESQKYAKQMDSAFGQFRQVPRFKANVLHYSALEARNQSASVALRLFYQLAELEAQADIAKQSLSVLQGALDQEKKLKAKGMKIPAEFAEMNEKYFGIQSDFVRIQDGIQQINRELGKLLAVKMHPAKDRIFPIADFEVADLRLDLDEEYAEAQSQRPQVLLGKYVDANLTARTLPAAMTLLKSYNSLIGMSGSDSDRSFLGQTVLILTGVKRNELTMRSEQLRQVNKEREGELYQELAQAIQQIERQANLVIVAKAQEQYWGKRTHDLDEQRKLGGGDFGALTAAKLKWMQSRSALVKEVMGWHQATVKWKEVKGALVYECGYSQCLRQAKRDQHCPSCTPGVHRVESSPQEAPAPQVEAPPQQLPEAILMFQEAAPAVTPDELTAPKLPH